jgi:hypothetical protein
MRKVSVYLAIGVLGAVICSAPPAEAFGLRIGPFHVGLPFFGAHRRYHRPLYMHANPGELPTRESAQDVTPALFYPNLALPAISQNIFFSGASSAWPFDYEHILSTAFAEAPASGDQRLCQPSADSDATVERIRTAIAPTPDQMQLLQKLGGALGAASGFLVKSCPSEIPAQPVARLQLMESQIEELTMAIDIIRQPLQDFEQSLNKDQQAKLAAATTPPAAAGKDRQLGAVAQPCGGSPKAIDWSINQIDKSVQPTAAQRADLAEVEGAFDKAVSDLQAHCPALAPSTAVGRLETVEARLDATWRSALTIQVALANFQTKLSDEQKDRFDRMNFAAAR